MSSLLKLKLKDALITAERILDDYEELFRRIENLPGFEVTGAMHKEMIATRRLDLLLANEELNKK